MHAGGSMRELAYRSDWSDWSSSWYSISAYTRLIVRIWQSLHGKIWDGREWYSQRGTSRQHPGR